MRDGQGAFGELAQSIGNQVGALAVVLVVVCPDDDGQLTIYQEVCVRVHGAGEAEVIRRLAERMREGADALERAARKGES